MNEEDKTIALIAAPIYAALLQGFFDDFGTALPAANDRREMRRTAIAEARELAKDINRP